MRATRGYTDEMQGGWGEDATGAYKIEAIHKGMRLSMLFRSLGFAALAVVLNGESPRFEQAVEPVLKARCAGCHNDRSRMGDLSVSSRDTLLKGGKSGAAIVPGKPSDSLLLTMVSAGTMPKVGPKLTADEIAIIRRWIEGGALRAGEQEAALKPVRESDVHAILAAKCWVCHGRREQKSGLDLRTVASMLKGGKSGAAIAVGNADASLLVQRIVKQEMPPPKLQEEFSVRGLTEDELRTVKAWIAAGAPLNDEKAVTASIENDPLVKSKDRQFWAFRAPERPSIPAGAKNPIDVLSKGTLRKEADRRVLIRRLYFDLTGLPPTPDEMAAAMADTSPDAYKRLVDRLLESPRYGERWARYWLDAVGYADSEGGTSADSVRPHAWRYRDYVIRAFNANKPFDRLLTEQVAGDELFDYKATREYTAEQLDLLAATGFWRMAPDSTYSTEQNFIPERMDVIANQLEVFGSAVLGLSVGCARCHDHKYDPIPQRDYYQLVSILTPAYDPYAWLSPNTCLGVGANCKDERQRHIVLRAGREYDEAVAHNAPIEKAIADLQAAKKAATDEKKKKELDEQLGKEKAKLKDGPKVRALFDLGADPPPNRILLRGDANSPGALVEPGVLSVLSAGLPAYKAEPPVYETKTTGRRLALARWLTHPQHPLTARVMVNRLWQHHFGEGLVSSAGNFGKMGTPPANQVLLDFLATEFVRTGWDIKAMHRLILTSATWKQEGAPRRLDSDALRDSILAAAGRLTPKMFGEPDAIETKPDGEVVGKPAKDGYRRTIYATQRRTMPVSLLDAFDSPFLNPNCVKRGQSTVSSQALHLMNSDLLREMSQYMAGRVIDQAGADRKAQIARAYQVALARRPTDGETEQAVRAMEAIRGEWRKTLAANPTPEPLDGRADWLALATVCHTILNSAEFQYVD